MDGRRREPAVVWRNERQGEVGTALPPVFAYWRELGALFVTALCAPPARRGARRAAARRRRRGRARGARRGRAADDRRRVRHRRGARGALGRRSTRRFAPSSPQSQRSARRSSSSGRARRGTSSAASTSTSPRTARTRRRRSRSSRPTPTRLSAHGKAQHLPARPGAARVRRRGQARRAALAAPAGAARGRAVPVAAGDGRRRRDLPPAALDAAPRRSASCATCPRSRRPASSCACRPTGGASRPPRPQVTRHRRRASRRRASARTRCSTSASTSPSTASALTRGGDRAAARRHRRARARPRPVGRGRPRAGCGAMLDDFAAVERAAAGDGLSLRRGDAAARRARACRATTTPRPRDADWSRVVAGPVARADARRPAPPRRARRASIPARRCRATLRPYQQVGRALAAPALPARPRRLPRRRHGPRQDDPGARAAARAASASGASASGAPSLLVAPGVAARQLGRGDRALRADAARARRAPVGDAAGASSKALDRERLAGVDLVITTYGIAAARCPGCSTTPWRLVVLDEAQAIKNPGAKQTRAVKTLAARARIALTGTPVENRLGDLWSIFDFLNPGLLGIGEGVHGVHQAARRSGRTTRTRPLRELVRPYILRRLKTDKRGHRRPARQDRGQGVLRAQPQAGGALPAGGGRARAASSRRAEGIAAPGRRARVPACASSRSATTRRSGSATAAGPRPTAASSRACASSPRRSPRKQEKVLVFTQFREMTAPLAALPRRRVFGRAGPRAARRDAGQASARSSCGASRRTRRVPFFVLSLKAGGTGLNLTAASHVIHFDRWWNPAVENQATDRAFRIGQTQNVLVHKFVCRGHGRGEDRRADRVEAAALAATCSRAARSVLLTELRDDELLELVALDLRAASRRSERMACGYYGFAPYVPVGARRGGRRRASWRSSGRRGRTLVAGRRSTGARSRRTFWGKAWCDNLERYSDFANRLPRGRTYVRNGSVRRSADRAGRGRGARVGLDALHGRGDDRRRCRGRAGRRRLRRLRGRHRLARRAAPGPALEGRHGADLRGEDRPVPLARRDRFTCTCPDWATMCKHVAAVLYGVGARLDDQPELLFPLRGVDGSELIARAGEDLSLAKKGPAAGRVLAEARAVGAVRHRPRRGVRGEGPASGSGREADARQGPSAATEAPAGGRCGVASRPAAVTRPRLGALYEPGSSSWPGSVKGAPERRGLRRTAASTSGPASAISSRAASRSRRSAGGAPPASRARPPR